MLTFRSSVLVCASILLTSSAQTNRMITDRLDQQVMIPDHVGKVVVLQHQTLNILAQFNAQQDIVGVMSSWRKQLGPEFTHFMPTITTLSTPGDLTSVNIESLLAIRPQVVFIVGYAPAEMIWQTQSADTPIVVISLRKDVIGQQNKMSPTIADEERVYSKGSKQDICLIADVVGRRPQTEMLIDHVLVTRAKFSASVTTIPGTQKVRIYIANPGLMIYGSGKYAGLIIQYTGGLNVAAVSMKGARQVALEQILAWSPQVIFVQDRYPQVITQTRDNPSWQGIDTVKNHRVQLMPEYTRAQGYPMPEALAVGELWVVKKLYPDAYENVDIDVQAQDYYQRFYRMNWQPNATK